VIEIVEFEPDPDCFENLENDLDDSHPDDPDAE
jgi:hypothetical protein